MLLSEIFDIACAYMAESGGSTDAAELRARAPSVTAGVIAELMPLDKLYTGNYVPCGVMSEDEPFPLCQPLGYLCAVKLASLLCADENEYLSQRLNAEYETGRQRFIQSLPSEISPIKNVY